MFADTDQSLLLRSNQICIPIYVINIEVLIIKQTFYINIQPYYIYIYDHQNTQIKNIWQACIQTVLHHEK